MMSSCKYWAGVAASLGTPFGSTGRSSTASGVARDLSHCESFREGYYCNRGGCHRATASRRGAKGGARRFHSLRLPEAAGARLSWIRFWDQQFSIACSTCSGNWPAARMIVGHYAIVIFSWVKASSTATERSLRTWTQSSYRSVQARS